MWKYLDFNSSSHNTQISGSQGTGYSATPPPTTKRTILHWDTMSCNGLKRKRHLWNIGNDDSCWHHRFAPDRVVSDVDLVPERVFRECYNSWWWTLMTKTYSMQYSCLCGMTRRQNQRLILSIWRTMTMFGQDSAIWKTWNFGRQSRCQWDKVYSRNTRDWRERTLLWKLQKT